jgi:anti-anti-sigma factor
LLGKIPNTVIYRNVQRHPQCETYPGIAIIRIEADLYFANISRFKKYVYELIQLDHSIHAIIVDSVSINYMDATCLHILESMLDDLEKKRITLVLVGAHAIVRETLAVGGITNKLKLNPKIHVHSAVQHFLKEPYHENETSDIVQLEDI